MLKFVANMQNWQKVQVLVLDKTERNKAKKFVRRI